MTLLRVPPPERHPAPANAAMPQQARLVMWLFGLITVGTMALWYLDDQQGFNTTWERLTIPLMGLTFGAAALVLWRLPQALATVATAALSLSGLYFIGILHSASQIEAMPGLYSLGANAQFMPLVYVGAFITLRHHAALLCWVQYAGLLAMYIWIYGLRLPTTGEANAHLWISLLITHPCYILALRHISTLHRRLSQTESEARASKERFLAMLSHEIRTPLQAMLGSIDLLDLKVQGAAERRAVDRLRQVSGQLDAHLRDITEYTRMDSPSWQLHCEDTDLARLVREACEDLHARARAQGLRLLIDIAEDERLRHVRIDPNRVRQILLNLLGNALKYTAQGQITVRLSCAESAAQPVRLDVIDTGLGLAPDAMARIFEPYVRLEDRRARHAEGSGLGLAVVHRLVDRLGGHLEVESTPEQGSRFTVHLPLHA